MQLSRYGEIRALLYDLEGSGPDQSQLDFYLNQYDPQLGRALEPMCGTGNYLAYFLKNGVSADGTDANSGMLNRCRDKCKERGFKTHLYEQKLEDMDLPNQYGYVFIPEGSFSHLYDKAVAKRALARIYAHMAPGGKLVMETHQNFAEPWETKKWKGRWHECEDGSVIVVSNLTRYEDRGQVFKCASKYELFVDGALSKSELNMYAVRFYNSIEFEQMLAKAGFEKIRIIPTRESAQEEHNAESSLFECFKPN